MKMRRSNGGVNGANIYLEAAEVALAAIFGLDFCGLEPDMTGEPRPVGVTDSLPEDSSKSI